MSGEAVIFRLKVVVKCPWEDPTVLGCPTNVFAYRVHTILRIYARLFPRQKILFHDGGPSLPGERRYSGNVLVDSYQFGTAVHSVGQIDLRVVLIHDYIGAAHEHLAEHCVF